MSAKTPVNKNGKRRTSLQLATIIAIVALGSANASEWNLNLQEVNQLELAKQGVKVDAIDGRDVEISYPSDFARGANGTEVEDLLSFDYPIISEVRQNKPEMPDLPSSVIGGDPLGISQSKSGLGCLTSSIGCGLLGAASAEACAAAAVADAAVDGAGTVLVPGACRTAWQTVGAPACLVALTECGDWIGGWRSFKRTRTTNQPGYVTHTSRETADCQNHHLVNRLTVGVRNGQVAAVGFGCTGSDNVGVIADWYEAAGSPGLTNTSVTCGNGRLAQGIRIRAGTNGKINAMGVICGNISGSPEYGYGALAGGSSGTQYDLYCPAGHNLDAIHFDDSANPSLGLHHAQLICH